MVHLDCGSDDFALFLGLIETGGRRSYNWDELSRVLVLGAQYQSQHIASFVRQPASHCIAYDTVKEIFHFAASNGFHDLAKLAVAGFGCSTFTRLKYDEMPLSVVKGIPGEYGAALIRAMAKNEPAEGLSCTIRGRGSVEPSM